MANLAKNQTLYHFVSLLAGILFYHARFWFYGIADFLYYSVFSNLVATQDEGVHYLVAFVAGMIDAFLPAVLIIAILHYVLSPKTKLFLIALIIGHLIFYTEYIIEWFDFYSARENMIYDDLVFFMIRPLGELLVLWLVSGWYLKYIVKVVPEPEDDPRFDV